MDEGALAVARRIGIAALVVAGCGGRLAQAAEDGSGDGRAADGTIVQLEAGTAYFDLGLGRGFAAGEALEVLRTITAKHPLSGEALVDHFPLGRLTVERVGTVLSYGRLERRIATLVKVGDVVRVIPRAVVAAPPGDEEPHVKSKGRPATKGAERVAAESPDARELDALFQLTLGKPPGERAQLLDRYLKEHADTPFAAALRAEIAAFADADRALVEARANPAGAAPEIAESAADKDLRLDVLGQLPRQLYAGDPFVIALLIEQPERLLTGFLYLLPPGATTYQRLPLSVDGDGYVRANVPGGLCRPPWLKLFVELIDVDGRTVQAGSAAWPRNVEIAPLPGPLAPPGPGHSDVRGFFEFVDYNRFRNNDYVLLAEGDISYRIGTWLWAVRTGFGVLNGRGGKTGEIDGTVACADPARPCGSIEVGYNYGYAEVEFRIGKWIGIVGRGLGGRTLQGPGMGGELRLRIGQETGTNLLLGASVVNNIGALGLLQLEWNVVRNWPMSASVTVTNQPAEQNIGVRLVYQVGYRARPWLQPTLRVGYNVRNIEHGGLSLGLGLVMGW